MSIADDNAPPTSDLTTGSTYKRSNLRLYLAIAIAIVAVALLVGLLAGLLTRNSSSSSSPSSTYRAVAVQYMAIANFYQRHTAAHGEPGRLHSHTGIARVTAARHRGLSGRRPWAT